jgi:hypothetical protein
MTRGSLESPLQMKEMLAGSLTNYCMHHARVPIISVPPKERAEEPTHAAPA